MERKDNLDPLYVNTVTLQSICKCLFMSNIVSSLVYLFTEASIVIILQIITAFLYIVAKCMDDGMLWFSAESARRKDNLQNGFDINLSNIRTKDYYNNDIKESICKYAVNTFESNFFSKNISEKMLFFSIFKLVVSIVVLIISCHYISNADVIIIIVQAILSSYVFEETVMLIIYHAKMSHLFEEAYNQLVTIGVKDKKQKIWLLWYVLEYESIKSYYKIRLSTKIFNELNFELSKEWRKISKNISISENEKTYIVTLKKK